jgi:hypothetical protein
LLAFTEIGGTIEHAATGNPVKPGFSVDLAEIPQILSKMDI